MNIVRECLQYLYDTYGVNETFRIADYYCYFYEYSETDLDFNDEDNVFVRVDSKEFVLAYVSDTDIDLAKTFDAVVIPYEEHLIFVDGEFTEENNESYLELEEDFQDLLIKFYQTRILKNELELNLEVHNPAPKKKSKL